jgi:L-asparagine transporter-like permease
MIKEFRVLIVLVIALIPVIISIFLVQDDMIAIPISGTVMITVLIAMFFIRKKNNNKQK